MKRIAGLLLTSLLLGASRLPATGAEETPQVLGVLEIRGLDALAAAAAELSQAIGSPAAPKEMIALMLYGALGTMPGMGIPPESTVRVVAFRGDAERNRWAALLPVTNDGAEYLDSLLQTGWKKESETAEGILHFVAAESAGLAVREAYFLKAGETLVVAASAEDARRAETLRRRRQRVVVAVDAVEVPRAVQPTQNLRAVAAAAQRAVHIDAALAHVEHIHRGHEHHAHMFKIHRLSLSSLSTVLISPIRYSEPAQTTLPSGPASRRASSSASFTWAKA